MTLEEFGATLKDEREKRGLSLEEVASKLKIGSRLLKALEEGDTANLPHVAYAKGFLRSYGQFLGIPLEEINLAISQLVGGMPKESHSTLEMAPVINPGLSRFIPQVLVLALFLGIVGGAGYLVWQRGYISQFIGWVSAKTESFKQKSPTEPKDKAQVPAPLSQKEVLPEVKPKPKAPEPKELSPAEALRKVDITENQPPRASLVEEIKPGEVKPLPEASVSPTDNNTVQEKPKPRGEFQQLVIVANEACWIHSSADKSETRQFSLRKGDTFALTFRDQLELKLGNAGGVRFRFNGEDLPPVGKSGQVKTVTFPSGEVQ
ncbi:MAG: helix-turn-helix domain-containing protein [Desulfovibrionaceae bacterium]|nr:helix-turn-helix domain-containing protein [Desulfovibrionaceae bacterium]